MQKILLLGSNGFTGIHFQDYLIQNAITNDYEIVGVDKQITEYNDLRCLETDLLSYDALKNVILSETPDYIINLVGLFTSSDFNLLLSINANISYNLLEILVKNEIDVKKVLLIGSAAEYGVNMNLPMKEDSPLEPIGGYGLSKAIQTQYFNFFTRTSNISINLARTFNIVGKYLSTALSVGSFANQIKNAQDTDKIMVGNLNTKRDYLAIEDVIDAYWKILMLGQSGKIYNVCKGESISMKEILEYLIRQSGKNITIETNPDFIRKNDILDSYGDNTALINDTQWFATHDLYGALSSMLQE